MRFLITKEFKKFLVVPVVLTLLVGCGTDTSTNEPTTDSTPEPTVETTAEQTAEPEVAEPKDSDILVGASMVLDDYIKDYDMSLAPQKWTIAKFDEEGAYIGMADITYNGVSGKYVFVGTPHMENGKVVSITPHYVEVNGAVLADDHYCDEVFDKIKSFEQGN